MFFPQGRLSFGTKPYCTCGWHESLLSGARPKVQDESSQSSADTAGFFMFFLLSSPPKLKLYYNKVYLPYCCGGVGISFSRARRHFFVKMFVHLTLNLYFCTAFPVRETFYLLKSLTRTATSNQSFYEQNTIRYLKLRI